MVAHGYHELIILIVVSCLVNTVSLAVCISVPPIFIAAAVLVVESLPSSTLLGRAGRCIISLSLAPTAVSYVLGGD